MFKKIILCVNLNSFLSLALGIVRLARRKMENLIEGDFLKASAIKNKDWALANKKTYNGNVIPLLCRSHCGAGKAPEKKKFFEREKSIGRND